MPYPKYTAWARFYKGRTLHLFGHHEYGHPPDHVAVCGAAGRINNSEHSRARQANKEAKRCIACHQIEKLHNAIKEGQNDRPIWVRFRTFSTYHAVWGCQAEVAETRQSICYEYGLIAELWMDGEEYWPTPGLHLSTICPVCAHILFAAQPAKEE